MFCPGYIKNVTLTNTSRPLNNNIIVYCFFTNMISIENVDSKTIDFKLILRAQTEQVDT